MIALGFILLSLPVLVGAYAYVGYPLILRALARGRPPKPQDTPRDAQLPLISITVPAYNEEMQIGATLDSLLALDYPSDRRQILVVSDASSDRTDEIVRSYADRGVELCRMPKRIGKTGAEHVASHLLRGEIIVNTDASIRIAPDALKKLIHHFSDSSVGLASGRDMSVSRMEAASNRGEAGYVGYEMRIRDLETAVGGIIGASGCFYAIRSHLHRLPLPEALSRDFAAALNVTENGFRAVSAGDAICYVPRSASLKREYRRKVRTITRGMETLLYKRALLNPFRFPGFAWKLFSHKVCRWLLPWTALAGFVGLALLATRYSAAAWLTTITAAVLAIAVVAWMVSDRVRLPAPMQLLAFAVFSNLAVVHASLRAVHGDQDATWEPTRREVLGSTRTNV
jgi:cellulose synthase/poly-beta-1,6-N-acetylglucosamine synthase-like glycosyltransferase